MAGVRSWYDQSIDILVHKRFVIDDSVSRDSAQANKKRGCGAHIGNKKECVDHRSKDEKRD